MLSRADVSGLSQVDRIIAAAREKLQDLSPVKETPAQQSPGAHTDIVVGRVETAAKPTDDVIAPKQQQKQQQQRAAIDSVRHSASPRFSRHRSFSPRARAQKQQAPADVMDVTSAHDDDALTSDEQRSAELTSEEIKSAWPATETTRRASSPPAAASPSRSPATRSAASPGGGEQRKRRRRSRVRSASR